MLSREQSAAEKSFPQALDILLAEWYASSTDPPTPGGYLKHFDIWRDAP